MKNSGKRMGKAGDRIRYALVAYAVGIAIFAAFRVVNALVFQSEHDVTTDGLFWRAMLKGWQFDTLISCFGLALPTLMLLIGELCHIRNRIYYAVTHHIIVTLYIVFFFACAADIPYFNYFFNHLNSFAVDWGGDAGIVVGMIVKEPTYLIFLLLFLLVAVGYWLLMRYFYRRYLRTEHIAFMRVGYATVATVIISLLVFAGMRGKPFAKSPLDTVDATFSSNAFLNKIGLNPVFTLIKSIEDRNENDRKNRQVSFMNDAEAERLATEAIALTQPAPASVNAVTLPEGTNVVVVLMESMSAQKVGFLNPESDLTPCLDQLMQQSLVFTEAYSAGTHTHDGIFSSLYGYPAILSQNQLMLNPAMCGLPQAFLSQGYDTWFFVPHNAEYDNMDQFLSSNGFQHIVDQLDYDYSQAAGIWGVPDHVMFDKAIQMLGKRDTTHPFLVTLLTCSDHGPYVFPDGIDLQPRHDEMKQKMVEYADWSIGRFMRQAAQQPWFKNTLFVFVADHGASLDHTYDMSLSHHHEPLFYYFPGQLQPERIDRPAMQIDLTPTLLAMMPFPWDNRTMGIDLVRQQRPYAFFNSDNMVGVVDGKEWFYLYRVHEQRASLYRYQQHDTHDHIATHQALADSMQTYALSQIQHTQTLLRTGKTKCEESSQ